MRSMRSSAKIRAELRNERTRNHISSSKFTRQTTALGLPRPLGAVCVLSAARGRVWPRGSLAEFKPLRCATIPGNAGRIGKRESAHGWPAARRARARPSKSTPPAPRKSTGPRADAARHPRRQPIVPSRSLRPRPVSVRARHTPPPAPAETNHGGPAAAAAASSPAEEETPAIDAAGDGRGRPDPVRRRAR